MQSQDKLYLYYWAEPAFRYYAGNLGYDFKDCQIITPIPGKEAVNLVDYSRLKRGAEPVPESETRCVLGVSELFSRSQRDLEQLQGQGRVWFVFTHIGDQEKNKFLYHLNALGARIDEVQHVGASAYLYDL